MANYYATARSNYFHVKDEAAFRAWAESLCLGVENDGKDSPLFMIYPDSGNKDGWPTWRDTDEGESCDVDLVAELAEHLVSDEVAILMECGAEKLRYCTGFAWAVNSKGERREVSIHEIYKLAQELGSTITPCEY